MSITKNVFEIRKKNCNTVQLFLLTDLQTNKIKSKNIKPLFL